MKIIMATPVSAITKDIRTSKVWQKIRSIIEKYISQQISTKHEEITNTLAERFDETSSNKTMMRTCLVIKT